MQPQNERFASIFHLLWDGKKNEAKSLLNDERTKLSAKRIILSEQLNEIDEGLSLLDTILPVSKSDDESVKPHQEVISFAAEQERQDKIDKNIRDSAFLEAAKELSSIHDHFTTMDVANIVTSKGVNMVCEKNRYSTIISRLLKSSGKYDRIGTGIFKAVSQNLIL